MTISRRDVLKQTVGGMVMMASGPLISTTFSQAAITVARTRMKLEDFVKNQKLVDSLKNGVAVMKARKPSDPRSWFFQAAIHGVSQALLTDATKLDPDISKVDQDKFWNQCPHYERLKAPSADFLIWHRAYLYHFERILRAASGDDLLCLPYWNYLEDGQRTFPRLYADPDSAVVGGPPRNPLYDGRRESAFTQIRGGGVGLLELNSRTVNTDIAFSQNNFFGAIGSDGFAGAANDLEPADSGLIERNPHNLLHLAIGGLIGIVPDPKNDEDFAVGLMANVPTAAFDPVFWAHHCNIDRLWSVWECVAGRKWGYAPPLKWFEAKPWWFYDVAGEPENHARSFYLQQKNLGIDFDSDNANAFRLSDKLPTDSTLIAFNLEAATGALGLVGEDKTFASMGVSTQELQLKPREPINISIKITGSNPFGAIGLHAALNNPPAGVERRAFLAIHGIKYIGVPTVSYEIYVNLSKEEIPDPKGKSFVGILSLFGIQHEGHVHAGGNRQIFDVTKQVGASLTEGSEFHVSFVPVPLLIGQRNTIVQPARVLHAETVTISGISLSGAEGVPIK